MAEFPRDYQVLVLDDASTDDTADVLAPYSRILPVTISRNATRQGYAASLEEMLEQAVRRARYPKRDIIVVLQADFTEDPEEIPVLVKRIEGGADVVSGVSSISSKSAPRLLRCLRASLAPLLRRLGRSGSVNDPLSGFRAYRINSVRHALQARAVGARLLTRDGPAANAELLRAVAPFARRIEEAPVYLRYDRRTRRTRFRPVATVLDLFMLLRRPTATKPVDGSSRKAGARDGTGTRRRRTNRPRRGDPGSQRRRQRPGGERAEPKKQSGGRSRGDPDANAEEATANTSEGA